MVANGSQTQEQPAVTSDAGQLSDYDLAIGAVALFSLVILVLLVFVPLSPSTVDVFNTLENLLCVLFLFDFLRSLVRAQKKWRYLFLEGGWLDLLGSLPFNRFAVFRLARLIRIVRVMLHMNVHDYGVILTQRLARSLLFFTFVVSLLLIIVLSEVVLVAERGAPRANILTYGDAVWWSIVTITTVGYGDYYPVTPLGRSMATILMFFGIGIIGIISSYLSSTFIALQQRGKAMEGSQKTSDEAITRGQTIILASVVIWRRSKRSCLR